LAIDLRRHVERHDSVLIRTTPYGDIYHIKDTLIGPNGKALKVITVWIQLHENGETRFVTLIPDKGP